MVTPVVTTVMTFAVAEVRVVGKGPLRRSVRHHNVLAVRCTGHIDLHVSCVAERAAHRPALIVATVLAPGTPSSGNPANPVTSGAHENIPVFLLRDLGEEFRLALVVLVPMLHQTLQLNSDPGLLAAGAAAGAVADRHDAVARQHVALLVVDLPVAEVKVEQCGGLREVDRVQAGAVLVQDVGVAGLRLEPRHRVEQQAADHHSNAGKDVAGVLVVIETVEVACGGSGEERDNVKQIMWQAYWQ